MKLKLWTLPPFAVVLGAMGYMWGQYDALPERIPVHWGLSGADRWADKTLGAVLLPGWIGLLVLAFLAARAWRLEAAGQVAREVALAWFVGVVVAVVSLLPLLSEAKPGL